MRLEVSVAVSVVKSRQVGVPTCYIPSVAASRRPIVSLSEVPDVGTV